jgi:hypothetical protein
MAPPDLGVKITFVISGFRDGLGFFLQDAAAHRQTIRANRHSRRLRAGKLAADHSLRLLAKRTLHNILHAKMVLPIEAFVTRFPWVIGISKRF